MIFLLFWMIPGRPRQIGVRWLEELIGALLQSLIITTVIGSVMVLDSFLSAGIPKYGFFGVAILNLATFVTGFRMRGRLENVVGMGAGSGASPFSGYMAMRAVGAMGKSLGRAGKEVRRARCVCGEGHLPRRAGAWRRRNAGQLPTWPAVRSRRWGSGSAPAAPGSWPRCATGKAPADPKATTTTGAGSGSGERPPNQASTAAVTRPGGATGPGSTGPSRNGSRPARHRSVDDQGAGPETNGGSSGSSSGSGDSGRQGTAAVPTGSPAKGSNSGAGRSARAGAGTVAAPSTGTTGGNRQQRSGTRSSTAAPGGARGGGQHSSPPARTGSAPAVRKGQPTVAAPDRGLKPVQSRPAPANPKANPTQTPRAAKPAGQPSDGGSGSGGGGKARATPTQRATPTPKTQPTQRSTPKAQPAARQSPPPAATPPRAARRTSPPPPRSDRPRRTDGDQGSQR